MHSRKVILLLTFISIFMFVSLVGCAPRPITADWEKTIMNLQDESLKKDQIIKDLQNELKKKTDLTTTETTTATQENMESTQQLSTKFSFDNYITTNVREYNLVKEQDLSLKALGDKLPSEYTSSEIDKLPLNFRMKYCITIPRDISEEELRSTFAQIIKDKSTENLDIDEIYIAAWYDEASVEKTIALARAEWCPEGRWEQMPPIIAESNSRDSYQIMYYFNTQIE